MTGLTNKKVFVRGSGGGGGSSQSPPPPPTREKDSLDSRQFATIQDLISEGEIEGFSTPSKAGLTKGTTAYNISALKDVYLNDTQILQTSAGSSPTSADYNFQDVSFTPRFGTGSQTYITGLDQSESMTSVGVTVTTSSPVTRTITATTTDAVRVTVTVPALQEAKSNGDIVGTSVNLKVQVQYNAGGYSDVINDTIKGRTPDAYQKDYRINITGAFPVDIRVVRVTADSSDAALQNAFQWTSYTEIVEKKQAYLNSAYVALRLDSKQFSAVPSRKFKIRGIKVRIPGAGGSGSGTPTVDINTGRIVYPTGYIFNGTMGAAQWTTCPAMVLLDLLTNSRYGFGDHVTDSDLDLYSFVNASKYSNELISNQLPGSAAGNEARFSCNVLINNSKEAYGLINELSGVMRCISYWAAGSVSISQDKAADSSYLFNLSNVGETGFSYSGSSQKTRHSVIAVSYFNMDTRDIDYEVIEDTTAIAKYGTVTKRVKAFACNSRGQAARLGKAILYAEQNESEVVAFTTSMEAGSLIRPGSIIDIADPVRSGLRKGGRIKSATTTVIEVDSTEGLDSTNSPQLSVILSDGSMETKDVASISGANITVNSAFSSAPNANSIWVLQNNTVLTQKFRVIAVAEKDGISYSINALTYNSGKYPYIETGATLATRDVTTLDELKAAPIGLAAVEKIVVVNNQAVSKLFISWQPVVGVYHYQFQYRFNSGNWVSEDVPRSTYEITNSDVGTYEIQVYSYNATSKLSNTPATLTYNAIGKTAVPADVANLTYEPISSKFIRLRWDQSTDVDVLHGGQVQFRHSSKTDGTGTWSNSTTLIQAKSGSQTEAIVPLIEGEYLVKFVDDGNRFSTNATSILFDLPDALGALLLATQREDQLSPTPFAGSKTNIYHDATANFISLEGELFDSVTDVDAITNFDTIGDITGSGTYNFANQLDLGAVYSLDLKRHLVSQGYLPDDLIDSRVALVDTWSDWDGAVNNVDAKLYVRVTNDNPGSGSPTWSAWQEMANGLYKARGFEFKSVLTSTDTDENIKVTELGFTAELQRRSEQSNTAVASGAAAKTITFSKPFFVGTSGLGGVNAYLPSIGITVAGLSTGDYIDGPTVTGTNFSFTVKNSSGASINRNFTWSAVGYGLGV